MSLFGGSNDGGAAAAEAQRQAAITQGQSEINQDFAGFTPQFYQGAATDYLNYATPQLMTQYGNTRNNLTAALGRSGLLNSSAGVEENASLGKELGVQEAQLTNNAQQQANALKSQVATQKANLTNELETSADPTAIQSEAIGSVSQLKAPTAIQPLGNLFADWTQQWLGSSTGAINNSNSLTSLQQILAGMGAGGGGGAGGSSYFVP